VAVIVAVVLAVTADVVTVKGAVDSPAPIVTLEVLNVDLLVLLSDNVIVVLDGAGAFSVTVPAEDTPPATVDGRSVTLGVSWLIVSNVLTDALPFAAVKVGVICAGTFVVVMLNVVEEEPAATVTLDGKVAHV
jgi:hypothetical protein